MPRPRRRLWLRTQMMRALPYLPWKGPVTREILRPIQQAANAITLNYYRRWHARSTRCSSNAAAQAKNATIVASKCTLTRRNYSI